MNMALIKERAAFGLYSLLGLAMLPVLAGYLIWRGLRQPEYFRGWGERFFGSTKACSPSASSQPVLWVHAVSVGETRAAAPLIDAWLSRHATHRVVLTHTTPTGRATGAALFERWITPLSGPSRLVQSYLPYDFFWANRRFLAWAHPALGALMETELWPGLIAQAKSMAVPLVLINARLSARSAARMQRFAWLAKPAIRRLAGIAAQTEADAQRYRALGKNDHIEVTGNMKFDVAPAQDMLALGAALRKALGSRRVWLCASTRDDEERELLAAWQQALALHQLNDNDLLLLVPRHPQRFDRVAQLVQDAHLVSLRRSKAQSIDQLQLGSDTQVLLADSLGEMFAYLSAADVVLMGASIPALGGQNPIEACVVGKPVFFGPHMFNFAQIALELTSCGAGIQVASYADWIGQGLQLFADAPRYARSSVAASEFARHHRGATEKTERFMAGFWPSGY